MAGVTDGAHPEFGGGWTRTKLAIVEKYLDSYTTVFKKQEWAELVYIDAFAGTGRIMRDPQSGNEADARESEAFLTGSVERALRVGDRRFDRLVFVELDKKRHVSLAELRTAHPHRTVCPVKEDANAFLQGLNADRYGCRSSFDDWRGVLFVDPFGAQLDWSTVKHVASLERLDMWLLFPVSAIGRMLPVSRDPDGIPKGWRNRLTRVFGDERWRTLYANDPQLTLLGENGPQVRERGVGALLDLYRGKLAEVFGDRLLNDSRTLRNSTNSPLFELIFCVGSPSPRAIRAAKKIARHLIRTI